jgi:hypothetical protein
MASSSGRENSTLPQRRSRERQSKTSVQSDDYPDGEPSIGTDRCERGNRRRSAGQEGGACAKWPKDSKFLCQMMARPSRKYGASVAQFRSFQGLSMNRPFLEAPGQRRRRGDTSPD